MPKGLKGFQKGHKPFPGIEKGQFKKGQSLYPEYQFKKGDKEPSKKGTASLWKQVREGKLKIKRSKADGVQNPSWFKTGKKHWNYNPNRDEVGLRTVCGFTKVQRREIYIRDNGICQKCGKLCEIDVDKNHPDKVNIDHIIPIVFGGTNNIDNGRVLCFTCNQEKRNEEMKKYWRIQKCIKN